MERNSTLDGVRGVLALVVLASHIWLTPPMRILSNLAVCAFFFLSGLVLTRAWDGRYGSFLLRRFVRLWPIYALCLFAGYELAGRSPRWSEFLWWPFMDPNDPTLVDTPAWSLCVEAWAMPFMPLIVFFASRSPFILLAAIATCFMASRLEAHLYFGPFFLAGGWASRFSWRWRPLEHAIPQWLGRISYPLYLCHVIVLRHAPGPVVVRVAAVFLVAQILTWTLERWSIDASHLVGRLRWPGAAGRGAVE